MSWQDYISRLMDLKCCTDAAIFGIDPPLIKDKCASKETAFNIYAGHPEGNLKDITKQQCMPILTGDSSININGVMLGKKRYTIVRNELDYDNTLHLKAKSTGEENCNATIHRMTKLIVVAEAVARQGAIGSLNIELAKMVEHLHHAGY